MPISSEEKKRAILLSNGCLREAMSTERRSRISEVAGGRILLYGDPARCPHGREFGCGNKDMRVVCIPHKAAWWGFLSYVGEVLPRADFLEERPNPIEEITQDLVIGLPKADKETIMGVVDSDFKLQQMPIEQVAREVFGFSEWFKQYLSERRDLHQKALKARR